MKFKTLHYITTHPLTKKSKFKALLRFFKRGVMIRLHTCPMVYPFVNHTNLLIGKGMSTAELQIYTGLSEFQEMSLLLHLLRKDELFVDVGANVGVYTILASGVGQAKSISIEPIPGTFYHLENNIKLNNLANKVKALNIGVGKEKSVLKFTENLDAVNHVKQVNEEGPGIDVPVESLDEILKDERPVILKIDVEGYETKVLQGALKILEKETLKVVIIELNGLANRYNFDENWIHQTLLDYGFSIFIYDPFTRRLTKQEEGKSYNTIYIRDLPLVEERVKAGEKYKVLNREI